MHQYQDSQYDFDIIILWLNIVFCFIEDVKKAGIFRLRGELIIYQANRRLCVLVCVHTFKHEYL